MLRQDKRRRRLHLPHPVGDNRQPIASPEHAVRDNSVTELSHPTENLLEDTDGLPRPPSSKRGTKQPMSVFSGAVAGCDRLLLTSASRGDVIAFEGTKIQQVGSFRRFVQGTVSEPPLSNRESAREH